MLCSGEIYRTIEDGSGFFQHGHTYVGHPVAAAAGLVVVSAILDRGLVAQVQKRGDALQTALDARFGQYPNVGDIRGRGLFRVLELVADRESKAAFPASRELAARVKKAAMAEGMICYPMSGTIDGQRGDHVLLAPPYIIDESHISEIVNKLNKVLERALEG